MNFLRKLSQEPNTPWLHLSLTALTVMLCLTGIYSCSHPETLNLNRTEKFDSPKSSVATGYLNFDDFLAPTSSMEVLKFKTCDVLGVIGPNRVYNCRFHSSRPFYVEEWRGKTCLMISRNHQDYGNATDTEEHYELVCNNSRLLETIFDAEESKYEKRANIYSNPTER